MDTYISGDTFGIRWEKGIAVKEGGFDHAGKWETSLLVGTYPELVDLSRCERNTGWFAKIAKDASCEIGKHMVKYTLE